MIGKLREIILTLLIELEVSYRDWILLRDQIDVRYKSKNLENKITKD